MDLILLNDKLKLRSGLKLGIALVFAQKLIYCNFFFSSRDNLCKNCKRPGHYARECPNVAICHNCGLPGYGNLFCLAIGHHNVPLFASLHSL